MTAPSERTRRVEPARQTAYDLLRRVDDGAYANLELPRLIRRARLDPRDAAFATELAFGVLRSRAFLDAVIEKASNRALAAIDPPVVDVLRLGTYQVLSMRVPAHAAVDQTVGLSRAQLGAGAGSFVNAVLRRVCEADRETWTDRVTAGLDSPDRRALTTSHPPWIVSALRSALIASGVAGPADVDGQLAVLLECHNIPPEVSVVARPGLATPEELLATAHTRASRTSPLGVVLSQGDPGGIEAVRAGRAAVQDEGSQLIALALAGAAVRTGAPRRWLDLCAGPGGKSGVLGARALEADADFVAIEVSDHRADLVRATLAPLVERAESLGRSVEIRTGDGRLIGAQEPGAYARVLVDVPCTGLGALRRRPEARWRRQPADLNALGPLQRDLLRSALAAVAPGGVVGYATCSPHPAETRFVVQDVIKKSTEVELIDARPLFVDASGAVLPDLGPGPFVQLWPHVHGTDAMFFALFRRL